MSSANVKQEKADHLTAPSAGSSKPTNHKSPSKCKKRRKDRQRREEYMRSAQVKEEVKKEVKEEGIIREGDVPLPPFIDIPVDKLVEMDSEALTNLMVSWYMCGYHTGYYSSLASEN